MNIESAVLHRLKNKLAIILGFCELLLEETGTGDARRDDLLQIQVAAKSALAELPPLPANEFASTLDPEAADAE